MGSPPHSWGQLEISEHCSRVYGLTPTLVGTTASSEVQGQPSGAHPHTRGDNS